MGVEVWFVLAAAAQAVTATGAGTSTGAVWRTDASGQAVRFDDKSTGNESATTIDSGQFPRV